MSNNEGWLIKIRNTEVLSPDSDSWSPTNNPEWTANSGRVTSGLSVGSRQYFKYKIPLTWTMIPEEDTKQILELVEDGPDYFDVTFYHRCEYITITCYASTVTPMGIVNLDGNVFYKKLTVNLVER